MDSGTLNSKGEPMMVQVVKTDPKTGKPPLCECHAEKIFEKYNASAGMKATERNRFFETADIDEQNQAAFVQARQFVQHIEHHLETGSWLYIYGDEERAKKFNASAYGTGKSYLTHCIGNYLTQIKARAIYTTEDKLYADIKATYSRDSEETEGEVMWRYENVPILMIDDMFKSKVTDWVEDKAFHLLNNRLMPGKVTIINSNFAPNRINLVLPKNGPAIASRILGQAALIEMIGKDRRRGAAKKRYMEDRGA
ncbi:DnaA/Hda family protein [Paenibacillus sp. TRM 82003]|nr:DnaA/Hda family protein [Paenibacillus sp. TRM 82003]